MLTTARPRRFVATTTLHCSTHLMCSSISWTVAGKDTPWGIPLTVERVGMRPYASNQRCLRRIVGVRTLALASAPCHEDRKQQNLRRSDGFRSPAWTRTRNPPLIFNPKVDATEGLKMVIKRQQCPEKVAARQTQLWGRYVSRCRRRDSDYTERDRAGGDRETGSIDTMVSSQVRMEISRCSMGGSCLRRGPRILAP